MLSRLHSGSVRAKLVAMALATTFAALLVTSVSMLVYDLTTFQQNWIDDLTTQAEIVAAVSAPAVGFNDPAAARQNLALLRVRPQIQQGAIYAANGTVFAAYAEAGAEVPPLPPSPGSPGPAIEGGRMVVYHPIMENGERVGTVYLSARYRLTERLVSYATILGVVMLASLLLAAVVATRLQQSITRPLRAVTEVARAVMQRRDFSLRVEHHQDELRDGPDSEGGRGARHAGEIGTLVDAFNDMLAEVGRRANALQEANLTLEREMAVRQGAERALLLADRRKDEFLATLAHELRNPLAPIRTGLDIMRLNGGDPAATLRARGVMERQLKQMVRLVDDLLDVSRINTGKLAIRRESLELHAVVTNALEIARPFIDAQGHQLAVHLPEEPVHVLGDTTRLAQVLSNLLNNAARYTPQGGHITLSADVGGDGRLRIRVADDGIGIAPDMLADIFEMFVQADASLERASQGLGVGLSLARRLVELHDGVLEAASDGPGKGSTFTVTLPVLAEVPQAPARPAAGNVGDRQYRILLVDDNEDFVNAIGGLLRTMGHTVHVCHDGPQALAAAEGFAPGSAPDFAFLDIGLPGLNGYDLARALRALPALGHTVMIAVTGWGQQKDRDLAFEAGFEEHLVKPVSVEQILAILAGHREGVAIADR